MKKELFLKSIEVPKSKVDVVIDSDALATDLFLKLTNGVCNDRLWERD